MKLPSVVIVLCFVILLQPTENNVITMSLSCTSHIINTTANYTLSLQRTLDSNGNTIQPSTLTSDAIITVYLSGFNLTQTSCPVNQTCIISGSTVNITGVFKLNINITSLALVLNNIGNPLTSNTQIPVSAAIVSAGVIVDSGSTSVTLLPSAFLSLQAAFAPGNVSSNSNLTLTIVPSVTLSASTHINATIPRYWKNSKKNSSTNIPSGVTCTPSCNLTALVSSYVVTFSSIAVQSGSSISLMVVGVVSCPTTEGADSIALVSYDSSNSQLDLGTTTIASTLPNYFPLTNVSAGTIAQQYNLSFTFLTANIFASNDTITIVLPSQTSLTSGSTVSLSNTLVSSLGSQLTMPNTIQIINNIITFANPTAITVTITNLSGIASTKPTGNLVASLYRNNFIYNYGTSPIISSADILTFTVNTTSINAASMAIYTLNVTLSTPIPAGGYLVVIMPDSVILKNCSSSLTVSICVISNANINFTAGAITQNSLTLSLGVRNPINSAGLIIAIFTYDNQGYLMNSGSTTMFTVQQSSLPSNTITVVLSSAIVYDIANYTFVVNLTGYQLVAGFGIISLPSVLSFISLPNALCTVNNQPVCSLNSTAIQFPILEGTQLYQLTVGQLRNPQSTMPFAFPLVVSDQSFNTYYNTTSGYYSATIAANISASQTNTNCTNSAAAIYNVAFTIPIGIILTNTTFQAFINGIQLSTASNSFVNPLSLPINNQPSLMPWQLSINIATFDGYSMLTSTITIINCAASQLQLTGQITGLPQDNTVITLSVNNSNNADTLIVYLPSEYTTNGIGCVPISNLSCTILTQQSLKVTSLTAVSAISFQLTNITNPVSSGYFTFDAYISGFLSGVNNNTVSYQSPCQLPCRACLSTNASACLDCMKVLITAFPILDPFRNMCVSACIDGYYNNQNICSICPPECKTCQSASNCTSCSASYNLFQNTCLTNCPDLYYPNNSICVACTPPCLSCVSSTLCKNCTQPYNLYTNQCLLQCPNTTISNSQLCVPCLGACQTCQGTLTNCTSCSSGNFRYNNTCVANCPNGYIVVGDACQLCIGCLTCISNQTTCTSCLSPNLLYNYSCISDCPAGYYSQASDTFCINCPSQCSMCTSASNCSSCISPYSLQGQTCTSGCPAGTMSYQLICTNCITGCSQCSSLTTCDVCLSNFFLYSSICLSACPNKTYASNSSCIDCPVSCATCNPLCGSCIAGYYLYNGSCLLTCPNYTTQNGSLCQLCSSLYPYCSTCTSSVCLTCDPSFLSYNGSCLATCPLGTTNITSTCQVCYTGCATCSNDIKNCTSCNSPYLLFNLNNSCVLSCPYPTIPNPTQTICISCNPECQTCVSLANCTSCANNYSLFNNNCLAGCPQQMYSSNNTCLNCSTGCFSCNSTICQQCSPSYYAANGVCYSQCPTDLPFAFNQMCNKCSQNCTSCIATACVACQSPLLISGMNCVSACPQNTILENNVRCVQIQNNTNNTSNNTSNNTNTNTNTSTTNGESSVSTPILQLPPFIILLSMWLLIVLISKYQYTNTYMFGAMSAMSGLMCILSWIVLLLVSSIINKNILGVGQYLMMAALVGHLIINVAFLVRNILMLRDDQLYQIWKEKRTCNKVCSIIVSCLSVLSLKVYLIQFSHLFNTLCLKAKLDSLANFSIYDVLAISGLITNLVAIASASFIINQTIQLKNAVFFLAVDCVVVSLIDILLCVGTKRRKGLFDESNVTESDVQKVCSGIDKSNQSRQNVFMPKLLSDFHEQPSMTRLKDGGEFPMVGSQQHDSIIHHTNQIRQDEGEESETPIVITDPCAQTLSNKNVFQADGQNNEAEADDYFKVEEDADATQCAAPSRRQKRSMVNATKQYLAPESGQDRIPNLSDEGLSSITEYSERQMGIQKYIDMTLQGTKPEDQNNTTTNDQPLQDRRPTEDQQKELSSPGLKHNSSDQNDADSLCGEKEIQKSDKSISEPPIKLQSHENHILPQVSIINVANELPDVTEERLQSDLNIQSERGFSRKAESIIEIPVPKHIEESINEINVQGVLVYPDNVLGNLKSPNKNSSKTLGKSSSKNLKLSSSSKNTSFQKSRTTEQLDLNTLERSRREERNFYPGQRPIKQSNLANNHQEAINGEQGVTSSLVTPNMNFSKEQHESQVNQLMYTIENFDQSNNKISTDNLEKHTIEESIDPEIIENDQGTQQNFVPQKTYLRESPRLAPFKFRRNKKFNDGPASHQTIHVSSAYNEYDSEEQINKEQEFQPMVVQLQHREHMTVNYKQDTVPRKMLPLVKAKVSSSSISSRASLPRRLQTAKSRSHEKNSGSLTSRDGVQLMLSRIQKSHQSQQKMRGLEKIYLKSPKH